MVPVLRRAFLLAAACAAVGVSAQTANTWIGADNAAFSTAAAWSGGAPTNNITTHYALFTAGNVNTPILTASRSIAGLEFSATATNGSIGGDVGAVLTLGAYGIRNLASASYTMSVNGSLALGTASTFTNNGDLFIFANTALGANSLTLAGTTNFGRINGVISGTGGVIVNNSAGGWRLNGSNTYSGGTTLTGGTLFISSGSAVGTGALTFNGGTLQVDSTATLANAITVANTANLTTNASVTLSGATTMTASRTFNIAGTGSFAFDGAVGQSGAGYALTKAGTGAMILNAASTYTGATTINGGTLALGASGTISSANLMLNGGTLAMAGTFSRALGTGAGQVQFGTAGGGFAAYGGALTVSIAGAASDWYSFFNGQNAYFGSTVSDNVVNFTHNLELSSTLDYFLTVADNSATSADKTVFSGVLSGSGNLNKLGAGQLNLTTASTRTGTTYVTGGTLRTENAAALGSGRVVLQNSTLQLATDTAMTLANNVTTNSGTVTLTSDRLTAGAGLMHRLNTLSLTGNVLIKQGANVTSGTSGISLGAVSGGGTFNVDAGVKLEVDSLSGSSPITFTGAGDSEVFGALNNGSGALSKSGTGTLTLGGASTRTGTIAFSGGTLMLGHDTALGSGVMTVSGTPILRATNGARSLANNLTLNTGLTIDGSAGLTLGGTVTNANNNTLTVTNTAATTFSGALNLSNSATNRTLTLNNTGAVVISGAIANGSTSTAGALVKNGSGVLTLSGTNTYGGNTTINAGTLNLTGSITNSALTTIASGATLTGAGSLGDLMLAGTYAPGNSPALVSLGDFTMGSTGLLQMEIGGFTRGLEYDALDIDGLFATGGTLDVAFINGFDPATAATFKLFNFTSSSGLFSIINLPTLLAGFEWDTSALYTEGELKITGLAIPEPSTYAALAGLGALAFAGWRRRRAGRVA